MLVRTHKTHWTLESLSEFPTASHVWNDSWEGHGSSWESQSQEGEDTEMNGMILRWVAQQGKNGS